MEINDKIEEISENVEHDDDSDDDDDNDNSNNDIDVDVDAKDDNDNANDNNNDNADGEANKGSKQDGRIYSPLKKFKTKKKLINTLLSAGSFDKQCSLLKSFLSAPELKEHVKKLKCIIKEIRLR
eukprot:7838330-Ditylum_brightwellii.AAC.1